LSHRQPRRDAQPLCRRDPGAQRPACRWRRGEATGRSTAEATAARALPGLSATGARRDRAVPAWQRTLRAVGRAAPRLRYGAPPSATRACAAAAAAVVPGRKAGGAGRALLLAALRPRRPPELHATPSPGDAGGRDLRRRGPGVLREPRLQHVA